MAHDLDRLDQLTGGYVLNLYSGTTGRAGNTIHPWNCHHIAQMTVPPRKIWGESLADLEQSLVANSAELDPNVPRCGRV